MKILFLTSRFPYPPHRGDKLKVLNLIRQLSRRHSIALLSFIEGHNDKQWIPRLQEYCQRVETVNHPRAQSFWNCVKGLGGQLPFQVLYYSSNPMKAKLASILHEWRPDLIHTHLIRMAPYTQGLESIPRVLDLTDAVSLYLRRFRDIHSNPLIRLMLGIELDRMTRFESIIADFQRVLVCSEVDRKVLENHAPDAKVYILPNGVDPEAFSPNGPVVRDPERIILTGNMAYYPNADAARYFVRLVLPIIQKSIPGVKLFIVGQNPPLSVRRLANNDVAVTGFVPDIRGEYMKSAVAISPVRFGAGTLNKILEPLALGIPVVATPVSVQGMNPLHKGILVGRTPEEFAEAVVRVVREPLYHAEAEKASEEIRSLYGWDRITEMLERLYADVLDLKQA